VYSDEENKMYCTLCKNGNVDSVFTLLAWHAAWQLLISYC
jgi:hypothetical protein